MPKFRFSGAPVRNRWDIQTSSKPVEIPIALYVLSGVASILTALEDCSTKVQCGFEYRDWAGYQRVSDQSRIASDAVRIGRITKNVIKVPIAALDLKDSASKVN
jgi:hypothetical protein